MLQSRKKTVIWSAVRCATVTSRTLAQRFRIFAARAPAVELVVTRDQVVLWSEAAEVPRTRHGVCGRGWTASGGRWFRWSGAQGGRSGPEVACRGVVQAAQLYSSMSPLQVVWRWIGWPAGIGEKASSVSLGARWFSPRCGRCWL